jgi:Protein of unknown function (DUF1579)
MKPLTLAALAALILLPGLAGSEEEGELSEAEQQAQMMELWQKWSVTDDHHKELAWYIGTWDTETGGVGPEPAKGVAEFRWIMEGRWLSQEMKSSLMGMDYHGFGIMGFDRFKKKWVSTWVSNMDTAMLRFEGVVVDPTGKVKSLYCDMDEYLTGEHDKPARGVYRKVDEDTFLYELWDMAMGPDGGKVLEIKYKRRKK